MHFSENAFFVVENADDIDEYTKQGDRVVKKGTFEPYTLKNKLETLYDSKREDAIKLIVINLVHANSISLSVSKLSTITCALSVCNCLLRR